MELHTGRVNPASVEFQVDVQPKKHDLSGMLREAISSGRLFETLAEAEPAYPMYGRLKAALARYQALAAQPLPLTLPPTDAKKIEPGQPYSGAGALRQLLAAYGDLPADAAAGPDGVYDATLAEAVKRFQERHGLDPDGVLGKTTLPALNVPPVQRVRQIELALERLRWLPEPSAGPAIGINIPEFKLWAFDQKAGQIKAEFRLVVVVGKSLNARTPVFADRMEYVVFSPYWNVHLMGVHSRDLAWAFVREHWQEMERLYPSQSGLRRLCEGITGLVTPALERDGRSYFELRSPSFGGKTLAQYLERLRVAVLFQEREEVSLRVYLARF